MPAFLLLPGLTRLHRKGPRVASREYLHSLRDKFADRSLGDTMRTPMSSTSGDSIMRFGRYEGTALKDVPLAYLLWTRADLSDRCRTVRCEPSSCRSDRRLLYL